MMFDLQISRTQRYALALLVPAAITGGLVALDLPFDTVTVALSYLLGVLLVATIAGLGPAILTSVFCFLAFNFFFVVPQYTLHVENADDVVRLLTFLAVAVVASSLAARARSAADRAQRRAEELSALLQLSQALSAHIDLDRIFPVIAETTRQLLHVPLCVVLMFDEQGKLVERARSGSADARLRAINMPIREGASVLGIVRVSEALPGAGLSDAEMHLLETLAAQARLALERARIVAQETHTHVLRESDRLKSALLASVSHDLRTPLAVIKGATSTLLAEDIAWDATTQRRLTESIDTQVDHLNRGVGSLLDMSRVEAGTLSPERDWHDLAEVVGATLQHMRQRLDGRPLAIDLAAALPLVSINAVLIEQVLANLLENALKYSPTGTPLEIAAHIAEDPATPGAVVVAVRDHGPGVPADDLGRIFQKFVRGPGRTEQASGAGLGLAICKGIVEAHGGRIWAENRPDGGIAFRFTLPHTMLAPQPEVNAP
jgi:two-component system sensor histidine kinase KdpD